MFNIYIWISFPDPMLAQHLSSPDPSTPSPKGLQVFWIKSYRKQFVLCSGSPRGFGSSRSKWALWSWRASKSRNKQLTSSDQCSAAHSMVPNQHWWSWGRWTATGSRQKALKLLSQIIFSSGAGLVGIRWALAIVRIMCQAKVLEALDIH